MHLNELLNFFKGAIKFARVEATELEDVHDSAEQLTYHRRIVWLGSVFAVVGVLISIVSWIPELAREAKGDGSPERVFGYVVAPLFGAIAGMLCGAGIACLFAPRGFLEGPLGQRLMKLVGTRSILVARFVALLVILLTGGLLFGPPIFALIQKVRGNT